MQTFFVSSIFTRRFSFSFLNNLILREDSVGYLLKRSRNMWDDFWFSSHYPVILTCEIRYSCVLYLILVATS